jgi:hypothetical protein
MSRIPFKPACLFVPTMTWGPRLNALALEPLTGSTPDNFAAYVRSEIERWAPIVKASGAALEYRTTDAACR